MVFSSDPTPHDLLIVAHPGHELLVYGWMATARPVVHVLTDGSGHRQLPRSDRSRLVVEGAGAICGRVFGQAPDDTWYEAILAGDTTPFLAAADAIAANVRGPIDTIAVDAVEHFNPMHDLAAAVAAVVARRTNAKHLLCYPVEHEPPHDAPIWALALDDELQSKKHAVANGYLELAQEVDEFLKRPVAAREALFAWDPAQAFAAVLTRPPFYEEFGRRRVQEGRFARLITYEGHVRPLALEILARA